MPRKKKKTQPQPLEPLVPRFAFGKFRGRTVEEVMRVESTYLAWFVATIDGCEEIRAAIQAHPRVPAVWESYQECRRNQQQAVEWRQGQFSEPTIDNLCDELFNPDHDGEQPPVCTSSSPDQMFHGHEAAERLKIIKAVHYGKYVQSGENLYCDKAGDEVYRFQVREDGQEYEPWFVTPETDLSEVPSEILQEMDYQMSYCGEGDGDDRDAKFSETRKHIQAAMQQRSPS